MRVFLKEKEGKNGSTFLQGYARGYGKSVQVLVFKASGNGVDAVANVIVKGRRSYSRPGYASSVRRRRRRSSYMMR